MSSLVCLRRCAESVRRARGLERSAAWNLNWLQGHRWLHVDHPPCRPSLSSSYAHGASAVSLLSMTVGQSLENAARRWPEREAVVFPEDGIRKTFVDFQRDVDEAAAGLLALGLQRGDRLGIWGPNMYEWILFQYATAKAGIIQVSLNPAYQPKEVEFTLRKVQCKAVLCPSSFKTQNFCEMLRQICPEIDTATPGDIHSARLPDLRAVIVTDRREAGMLHVDDVFQAAESRHRRQLSELHGKLSCDDAINIQFTSGTTGDPKGVTLSHHNVVNNAYFLGLRAGYDWRPSVRVCMPVPLYHCFGSVVGGMCMAMHGLTLVFPSTAYDSRANLEAMHKEKCTFIYGTPTMFADLLGLTDLEKYDLSSMEGGIMAASPCAPELVAKVREKLHMKELMIGYGTTENSPVTFLGFPLDNDDLKLHTVGCVMHHVEAKVVDVDTGETVPLGATGELLIRGSCVMHGYWDEPNKTREVVGPDRWYRTGDVASLNALGYCSIEGRIKDMIIRGGENIYPADIERFLYTHHKVLDVQVVGVKDDRLGEQVCACVRLREGQTCSADEIRTFCKGQISHFKIPHYVVFVDNFPMTASRKIKKNVLKADMEKHLGLSV
ncbi:medium-chain acyl-CoA ligase ACSF2, mitochondrial-like isoform X2 [Corythoichthys intestinalis]|uniref:medium-chain acyl-CoA ligase ACSF2, mitochondrial-like isoform X2 n=1 Tax=Corythoichthys intestinalis TaxID=161448 RepID=UPI0025A5D209|nr:medium-chain acyl-CoA ligase ACSF2, mitochondrial-like isoform X2 [Corythoichthys intestinalis]